MSRPPSSKPVSSNTGSRPVSQQPVKKPMSNGVPSRPSNGVPSRPSNGVPSRPSNGTTSKPANPANRSMSKSKPVPVKPNPGPPVRYVNGKPVPVKGSGAPEEPSNLGKRSGDHLGGSKYEPHTGKKPVTTLGSILKGEALKKPRRGYEEDDDDYDDDFIDDGDPNEEAAQELSKIFGGYRKRVERTRHLVEDDSDMEAGFDVIEKEEFVSRLIGDEEDRREAEYIRREAEEEAARERMKKKKLQLD